jgi:hypothetical protein
MSFSNRAHVVAIALILGFGNAACQPASPETIRIGDLEDGIKGDVRGFVTSLYYQPEKWEYLRSMIGNGEPRWIEAGVVLYGAADGGARTMLAASFGEALQNAAMHMLQLMHDGKVLPRVVCAAPDIDDDRYGTLLEATTALNERIAAVGAVSSPDLADQRTECLRLLGEAEGGLKRFFGGP